MLSKASKLYDHWNMARRFNLRKLANIAQLLASYYYSRITKRAFHSGMPFSVSVEPTTSCNLRCPECPSGLRSFFRPTGMLQVETMESIVSQIRKYAAYLTLYFQGEPYLNKEIFTLIQKSEEAGLYTAISTNAHYLTPYKAEATVKSGLSRLIISMDGTTQEVYEQYRRGGKLNKVLEGARNIRAAKDRLRSRTPYVILQFLVVAPNEHQISELEAIADELGIDEVKLKSAQLYEFEKGNPLMPQQEQYSRYRKGKNGLYRLKNKLLNQCWRMWQGCVFTWDGAVVPCCFDKDAHYTMGSVAHTGFRQIWRSSEYKDFRSKLLKGRSQIDICANCTEGTEVWV